MYSVKNSTSTPLDAHRVFIGTYDTVSSYNTANITFYSDTSCLLTCYQSQNKTLTSAITYKLKAGVNTDFQLQLNSQYVYFTLLNNSDSDQTVLSLSVIYRNDSKNTKGSFLIWDAANTGSNGTSDSLYIGLNPVAITVYGSVDSTTTLRLQLSNDNVNFYDTQYNILLGSSGTFGFNLPVGTYNYVRFSSTNDVVASVYLNYS